MLSVTPNNPIFLMNQQLKDYRSKCLRKQCKVVSSAWNKYATPDPRKQLLE